MVDRAPLMMPFGAVRASADHAGEIASPPYDVLSLDDAKNLAKDNKNSFVRVSRPEVDFENDVDPYCSKVYERAATNFKDLLNRRVLVEDVSPSYYIWQMKVAGGQLVGVAGAVSVESYDQGYVKKHELTRPIKEKDRVQHIEALGAHTGPVMLGYYDSEKISQITRIAMGARSIYDNLQLWGVTHSIWGLTDPGLVSEMTKAFGDCSQLYIADGHHRTAAASVLAKKRRELKNESSSSQYFLGVAIPISQLQILAYNRVVRDLNGYTADQFLSKLSQKFEIIPKNKDFMPNQAMTFGLYINGSWYKLKLRDAPVLSSYPEDALDVSVLSNLILKPILGISDPRTDNRVDFIGGIDSCVQLMQMVDNGKMACAFSLFPTKIEDLMLIADSNGQMPPKSTWFEPKLVDGLLSMKLE